MVQIETWDGWDQANGASPSPPAAPPATPEMGLIPQPPPAAPPPAVKVSLDPADWAQALVAARELLLTVMEARQQGIIERAGGAPAPPPTAEAAPEAAPAPSDPDAPAVAAMQTILEWAALHRPNLTLGELRYAMQIADNPALAGLTVADALPLATPEALRGMLDGLGGR